MSDFIEDLYLRLKRIATELTAQMGQPVTIRQALLRLFETEQLALGDLTWSWRVKEHDSAKSGTG